ncbi:ankyrin repeat-containing protein NPR4-like [Hevea brasiliensis]|uniref:ankyrin repeat-containing protein NPR4-like n=1 Tax=Hevea brasiliensis TaxID=3981 RepID=UPI0025D54CAF|nr:ankyrin repeat-containing protein NPR4-like [Hevea brasiliensis]
MPSAFWSGYTVGNIFEYLVYFCIPGIDVEENDNQEADSRLQEDLESGKTCNPESSLFHNFVAHLRESKCARRLTRKIIEGCPVAGRIWEEKRKHKFALQLAKRLIRNTVWVEEFDSDQFNWSRIPLLTSGRPSPLFIAIKTGILEIVSEIIDAIPQYYVDLRNNKGQSILHWAVMYRREEIFDLLKDKGMSWDKMARKIDDDGNTLLHLVADTKHYTGGTKPGPALQLQEELQWFDRVKSVVPSYYPLLRAKMSKECQNGLKFARVIAKEEFKNPLTPRMLFELTHKKQLEEAQTWIKETSQSCSTVAALVATVVFAAAYTVPGGVNERGFPVFLRAPYFIFFTVMDVIALAFSLTSVVAFLSILTSPFEFDDFRRSIPWKLNFGFILLFFSVISAMLAFGATILLVIRSEKEWTTSLISIAAFFPVSVFTILQIHLYRTLIQDAFETAWKILPCFGMFSQSRARKQH